MEMCLPQRDEFLDDPWIRLPQAAVRSTGLPMAAAVATFLESVDPLMASLSRDAVAFGQIAGGLVAQPVVFEETFSLFAHGDTPPKHGSLPPQENVT